MGRPWLGPSKRLCLDRAIAELSSPYHLRAFFSADCLAHMDERMRAAERVGQRPSLAIHSSLLEDAKVALWRTLRRHSK